MDRPLFLVDDTLFVNLIDPYLGIDRLAFLDGFLVPLLDGIKFTFGDENLRYLTAAVLVNLAVGTEFEPAFGDRPHLIDFDAYRDEKRANWAKARRAAERDLPNGSAEAARLVALMQPNGADDWQDAYRSVRHAYLAYLLAQSVGGMQMIRSIVMDHVRREARDFGRGRDMGEYFEERLRLAERRWLRDPSYRIDLFNLPEPADSGPQVGVL